MLNQKIFFFIGSTKFKNVILFLAIFCNVNICNAEEKCRANIDELFEGLDFGASITAIIQVTNNANGDNPSEKSEDVADGSYSIDLELEKKFKDFGKGFIHVETGDGAGVEDELKVFSNVNRDADDSSDNKLAVTEFWYEYNFKSMPITLTAGKIDGTCFIDTNNFANCECTQFLGRIFRNSPAIEFPDNAAGIRLGLAPNDLTEIDSVLMDADSDWEDVFEDIFLAAQVNFKPKFLERDGNYRFIGWLNDREHSKWSNSGKTKEEGIGFGISCDQQITDYVGAFLRYGWQDPEQRLNGLSDDFSLEHSWSIGAQISGSLWNREEDVLAFAIGGIEPSDDYKKAGTNLKANHEGHFEAYYSFKLNEYLTVAPDLHIITNPYGDDATNGKSTITVFGIRTQLDF